MPRVLSKPLIKTYEIDDFEVTFVQMTDGDFSAMADWEGQYEERFNPDGTFRGYARTINNRRSERIGIYRTMVSCTASWKDEDGLIFTSKDDRVRFGMSENAFNSAWDLLPLEMAQQIVNKWKEHNPVLLGESKATSTK